MTAGYNLFMKKIYVIAGATATGKTAVAVELAKKIGGEVISADSMQVYRGMDIGTAKPNAAEMAGIPHYLLDIVSPDEAFSAAEFQKRVNAAAREILARGNTPIIAGGTGFYINAWLYGTEFNPENEREEILRKNFSQIAQENGVEFLHALLAEKDPAYAASIHPNNVKRVARALAFCETTGEKFSEHNAAQKRKNLSNSTARKMQPVELDINFFVLSLPREILYERINSRVIAMFDAGLADEVQNLLDAGFHKGLAAMQGIGYKEIVKFLGGELTRDEAIAATQQATRNYAKRQETWFRNQVPNAHVIAAEGKTPTEIAAEILKSGGR